MVQQCYVLATWYAVKTKTGYCAFLVLSEYCVPSSQLLRYIAILNLILSEYSVPRS